MTSHRRILKLLSDGAWHPGPELQAIAGRRFGARIHELRHDPELGLQKIYKRISSTVPDDFDWRWEPSPQPSLFEPKGEPCTPTP